ncbi:MAG: S9 family peptidase [Myxococcales bacterium FL481]|nr:MAG: S9 family peptidase [Myxococcales bacterium FL481]
MRYSGRPEGMPMFKFRSVSILVAWGLPLACKPAPVTPPEPAGRPVVAAEPAPAVAGSIALASADYARAERFLPWNIRKLVLNTRLRPTWIDGHTFWYRKDTRAGGSYVVVDATSGEQRLMFDHERLAKALSRSREGGIPSSLNLEQLEMDRDRIRFEIGGDPWSCELRSYTCESAASNADHPIGAIVSPDGRWSAYVKDDHNLYLHETGKPRDVRLTGDAEQKRTYATWLPSVRKMIRQQTEDPKQKVELYWSPDSSKFISYRLDWRDAPELSLVQHVPTDGTIRPKTYRYAYALPGDTKLCTQEPIVFHVKPRRRVDAKAPKIPMRYDDDGPWYQWSADGSKVRYIEYGRGNSTTWLREIDANTGRTRVVLEERSATRIDPSVVTRNLRYVNADTEFIWASERDGWAHLYLYDAQSGRVKRQITRGNYVARRVLWVDEAERTLYFIGAGKEAGRDPYERHVYRVSLDGGEPTLLTPEDADHSVSFSPSGDYFVDTFSRPNTVPQSVVRTKDGALVRVVEQADISSLRATGWQAPEPFVAKGRDGTTDVYGLIYRPSNFDPSRKYPIIENIYSGPSSYNVSKDFHSAFQDTAQSIAELGFIVVMIDGLGTGKRDAKFTHQHRKNLGDSGFLDRIAAIQELGRRYHYIDIGRVGVFGFSAGGYNAARALFAHPEFYKVGVSASGNHDHRLDKADWNEKWMGFPVGPEYEAQANATIAHRLTGKLLLVYGDLDHNVPPANTHRLIDALIKANRDFDLFVMPNEAHYLEEEPYFIRRRWDFFVEHLLGASPPKDYEVAPASW